MSVALLEALDALPRRGWLSSPTQVDSNARLAETLGLGWFGVKRDDEIPLLFGGSKIRKLDYLLASEPFAEAERWASVGAVGSGHLVALTAAAELLGRRLEAHCFWEPAEGAALENLRYIASGPTALTAHSTRIHLALRHPALLLGRVKNGVPVIPPGATIPVGIVGMVRAGVELALQIERGELPAPDRIYVALGSGGTAVGIAFGLVLAGRPIPVHAVSAVERPFAPMRRLQDLLRETREWLVRAGIGLEPLAVPVKTPLVVRHGFVGPGYGLESRASRRAVDELSGYGIRLEPLYSGKAVSALLRDAARGRAGERVLFWLTPRRAGPLPHAADWLERLPPAIRRRMDRPAQPGLTRRHALVAGGALGLAGVAALRTTGYPERGFTGVALAAWEAEVVCAAAHALLDGPPERIDAVPAAVDRYLAGVSARTRGEIHALLAVIEHVTPWSRFSRLGPAGARTHLSRYERAGGLLRVMYRGLRDLVMLGYYQDPRTWPALGYGGPLVAPGPREDLYGDLRASSGARPPGWT